MTTASTISVKHMESILEKLKCSQTRESTKANYITIWRQFNKFVLKLDKRPKTWENCASLYGAYLVDQGVKSSTLQSYISAIKNILTIDGYDWQDKEVLLNILVKACRLKNDVAYIRVPIHFSLFELLLFELDRMYGAKQPYLNLLYRALFSMAYYGLMRVGELTESEHVLKAKDVYIGDNKNKLLLILHSSKTHGKESLPQQIKISERIQGNPRADNRFFCPFVAIRNYMAVRGRKYATPQEQFFILTDKSPIKADMARNVLSKLFKRLEINPVHYSFHSFRIGRATDLLKFGKSVEQIQRIGRWRSNAMYKYFKL